MDKRLGFVGIMIESRERAAAAVQALLAEHAGLIQARMGLPQAGGVCSVITLIVIATTDELGRLTGRLGALPGVTVRSALAKQAPISASTPKP